ncbi:hypothetical protein C6496_18740 [Candidatus Poribacteria bacterium]|nr:MAG: hypothetical protein C6496_18740 [Candidatus Poribacteria bacterium]
MGTQLIFTVGTNPLPVWVAWHHLKGILIPPISVRFVHTQGTVDEKDRLVRYCHEGHFMSHIQTSPGDPGTVRQDVEVILKHLGNDPNLHVHYTGGTKVMSVETVAGLEYDLPEGVELETSYLDPRGNSGPTIVNSYSKSLVTDTRVNVPADLAHVAHLNGFTLGPFVHQYWNEGRVVRETCPAPAILDDKQEANGRTAITAMGRGHRGRIDWRHFEYAAYVALKEALEQIKTSNATRSNYQLFHSVNVRRTGANQADSHFELDVVAVLGYQILVISCTLDTQQPGQTQQAIIKRKGMEAILRARQLGGDEAQAIVLCNAHPNNAGRVERELHDEVGSAGTPLRVWGTDKWPNLSGQFYNYLRNDLYWM